MLNRKLLNATVNEENWSITKCWFLERGYYNVRLPAAVREMSPRSSPEGGTERAGETEPDSKGRGFRFAILRRLFT